MNIQRFQNGVDEAVRAQMNLLVDAVRGEQQRQFLDILDIFMQNGNTIENAQRALPNLSGVDMGFIHNLQRKLKTYNEWHARKLGAAPTPEDVAPKPRGRPPAIKVEG